MASNCVTVKASNGSSANGLKLDDSIELHKAAFNGDVARVKELLDVAKLDPKSQDPHGVCV